MMPSPGTEAGITDHVWDLAELLALIAARATLETHSTPRAVGRRSRGFSFSRAQKREPPCQQSDTSPTVLSWPYSNATAATWQKPFPKDQSSKSIVTRLRTISC